MIINHSLTGVHGAFVKFLHSHLPQDRDYYYLDINKPNILKTFDLNEISNLNLFLDCANEGFRTVVDVIYEDLVVRGFPEDRIFLVSGAVDIKQIVKDVALKLNKKPFFAEWVCIFQYLMSINVNEMTEHEVNKNIDRAFVCLNRRWRIHRPTLIAMLAKRNILDKGYVSLTQADHNVSWTHIITSILETHKDDKEIYDFFSTQQEYIKSLTPLILDQEKMPSYDTNNNLTVDLEDYYNRTYFSVVTETNFYSNIEDYYSLYIGLCEGTRFITEKTFKPVAYKHPFILMATPYTLQVLETMGYKTFHPFIDESYDKELDDGKRLLMIIDEIERLSKLDKSARSQFIKNTKPICEHNFQVLKNFVKK